MTETTADQDQAQIFGHPRGLMTLFFTEMWERLSFYGMRALLVLFMSDQVMNGGMGLTDRSATAIYGIYTALVYVVALPGGPGTLDELIEVLTWRNLGLHQKPVFLLNTSDYWGPLLALFDHMATEGFVAAQFREYLTVVESVDELMAGLGEALR